MRIFANRLSIKNMKNFVCAVGELITPILQAVEKYGAENQALT